MKSMRDAFLWLAVPLRGTLVLLISSLGLTAFAETPAPTSEASFWNNTVPAEKPSPPKSPAAAPKPTEPARAVKPSLPAETLERLEALEKRVAELSAVKETEVKSPPPAQWTTGYKDGGGGFFWASPDQSFLFKMLGYVQVNHMWMDNQDARIRANGGKPISNDFYIRRARLDFSATVYKNTELFVEFEGGVPTSGSSQSDFAMIEAKINHRIVDPFQLRFGKFVAPFSNENAYRSSRALDTAERYAAVNTLIGSPALESQIGAMAYGNWAKKRYDYALGVFNGNNSTVQNYRDDNSQKNVVGHFTWKPRAAKAGPMSGLSFGLGWDWDRSLTQTLTLRTLAGTSMSSLSVKGDRLGFSPDMYIPVGKWLEIRGEGLFERFNDSRANLYGGFGQVLWNVFKTEKGMGFSPLVRAESAVVSESVNDSISRLNILTVGWNFYINKNLLWRCNYLPTYFRSVGTSNATLANAGHYDEVLNQIMMKF